ncbi:hypothetical protein LXA43DRAFT_330820 [Ganoderma leucocontextum]|nr:hypothetical protein LXA43DRAFT_330820 [Ganoderma leucocontextum]
MLPSPSHALLNQDVAYVIFQHLAVPDASWYDYDTATCSTRSVDDTTERRGTLARCARVCRALLFPAVSVLWRNLDSLETLGVLAQSSTPQKAEVAVSVGLSWLPTYAQYSHWVRGVHNPSTSLVQSFHLRSPLNDGPYLPTLPRLTRLRWVQEVPGTTDLLPLLSPALRSLHILFRSSRNTRRYEHQTFVGALFLQTAERVPNLRYLRITRASGIPEAWLLHVDQFARVEVLDISEPTYDEVTTHDLLPRLAAMGSLRSLRLRLSAITYSASDPAARSFSALRDLYLDCKHASLNDGIVLLRAVSSHYLESVRIEHCECTTNILSASLLELCTILHAGFASTLHAVSLSVTPIGAPNVFEHPLVKYLEPLLRIRELAEFRFCISRTSNNISMPVPESNLAASAESWPRLTRLDLNYVPVEGPPALRTLLFFARQCPSLTSLNLPCIDARNIELLSSGPPHLSLTSCSVSDCGWDSLIPDPEGLAQFLKALFPNLTLFRPRLRIVSEPWVQTVESLDGLQLHVDHF